MCIRDSDATSKEEETQNAEPEIIHSRSVQMGSERLGVVAKMDLVEVRAAWANVATGEAEDLFSALEVCPVDYKAGAPKEGEEANELWDTDKMQLCLLYTSHRRSATRRTGLLGGIDRRALAAAQAHAVRSGAAHHRRRFGDGPDA